AAASLQHLCATPATFLRASVRLRRVLSPFSAWHALCKDCASTTRFFLSCEGDMSMTTINVPLSATIVQDARTGITAYLSDVPGIVYASSESGARKKLRALAEEQVARGLRAAEAGAGWIIGTNSGTIIVVRFANDCWQYSMCGADRSGASSVMGWKDLKSSIESA